MLNNKRKADYININDKLSNAVITAMEKLEAAGRPAYLVGGSLRDILMGKKPHDFDVASSATPQDMMEIFSEYKVIPTGLRHGTVTVLIDKEAIEITTFRKESGYSDGRRPDKISFSDSILEDLERRDFTINTMAYRVDGQLLDLFGGRDDIRRGVIRAVGDARERFGEDGLRILRAIRFASAFGFDIEEDTKKSIHEMTHMIERISAERITAEFNKIILSEQPSRYIREYIDIICIFIPELKTCIGFNQKNHHHIYDVFEHTLKVIDNTPPRLSLRLAALFHDIAKPLCFELGDDGEGHFYGHASKSADMASRILRRLKYGNSRILDVYNIVKYHDLQMEDSDRIIKRMLRKFGEEGFFDLIEVKKADNLGQSQEFRYRQKLLRKLEDRANGIIAENSCFSLKDMEVNGKDLINLGISQGPEIGKTLELLLGKIISGDLKNKRDELLAYVKSNTINANMGKHT